MDNLQFNKGIVSTLFSYFIRGVLTIVPFALTWYLIIRIISWVDDLIKIDIPGLGILVSVGVIIFFGYIVGSFFVKSIFISIERVILKMPIISLIYSSIKDFTFGVLDKKMNFDRPVLITVNSNNNTRKIGFITNDDLQNLGLKDMVAVYVPSAYAISGEVFVLPKEHITHIKSSSGPAMMKFVISGGVIETKQDTKSL